MCPARRRKIAPFRLRSEQSPVGLWMKLLHACDRPARTKGTVLAIQDDHVTACDPADGRIQIVTKNRRLVGITSRHEVGSIKLDGKTGGRIRIFRKGTGIGEDFAALLDSADDQPCRIAIRNRRRADSGWYPM